MSSSSTLKHSGPSVGIGRPECLVIMPMLEGYEDIRAVVSRALSSAEITMRRLEELLPDHDWQYWLVESVGQVDFVLADVTDHNPFVMYELGLVHQRKLPTVLIVNGRNDRVSATVLGSPFLSYDTQRLNRFEGELTRALQAAGEEAMAHLETHHPSPSEEIISQWYAQVSDLLETFIAETEIAVEPVRLEEFTTRLRVATRRGARPPSKGGTARLATYLMPRLIRDADKVEVMKKLSSWLSSLKET